MDNLAKTLGQRIKTLRKSKHLLQSELAEKVGIDVKYLSRLETGLSSPSLKTIEKLALSLNIDIKSLFEIPTTESKETIINTLLKKLYSYNEKQLKLFLKLSKIVDDE